MNSLRLAAGGMIDRSSPLTFHWDNRRLEGFKGDTLASALLANGETVVARSFKYHRPRGVMSAGCEEAGALATVGEGAFADPNVTMTTQELYDGLVARGQNAWPSVRWDIGAVLGVFGRFLSAGFYYKTFMGLPPFETGRGTGAWMFYEKFIRRSAGLGTVSRSSDPDRYEHDNLYCDVLVVGGGISGIAAALTAAKEGLDVVLAEQDFNVGGDLLNQRSSNQGASHRCHLQSLNDAGVRVMLRTTAFGLYENGVVGLLERRQPSLKASLRQKLYTLRAKHIVLACGAIERPLAFGNNDRPGIMSASGGRAYANRYAVLPGRAVVVATNNSSAYQTAIDLADAGASVTLLDTRRNVEPALADMLKSRNIALHMSTGPCNVQGRQRIRAVELAHRDEDRWTRKNTIPCDSLLVSGGWSPVVHLQSQRGGRPVWDDMRQCFLPDASVEGITFVGAAAGHLIGTDCETSGHAAGEAIAGKIKRSGSTVQPTPLRDPPVKTDPTLLVEPNNPKKAFVDPLNDVTVSDIRLARQEGFVSVEHLKRYTTLGMGNDQGKVGNVIGLAIMAAAQGTSIPDVGTTRFRPPYTPISLGALAGPAIDEHFKLVRRTPMHDWNLGQGTVFTDAGLWQRTWYFPRDRETLSEAHLREAATVRRTVGMCDVTSLGKIAVQGPDSARFLDRVYANAMAKLAVGRARYGIMLRDDGIVMDDGTVWRESEDQFIITTTTTNAGKVMTFLEELLQVRWPDLRVHVTSVTDQWAGFSLAGPLSRDALQACLASGESVSNDACLFMTFFDTKLKSGVSCRIARISFSGELAYEVYVSSSYGGHLAQMLASEVEARGGCQYGLEALGTLRIEKGHVTGAELDGRVTLEDAGLGGMASKKKPFIGSTLRNRPELMKGDRPRLVGIVPMDRTATFNAGSILCLPEKVSGFGEGWVTSVTHSPALGHWIGLGFIKGGHGEWADRIVVAADPLRASAVDVQIVSPQMFDPEGARLHG